MGSRKPGTLDSPSSPFLCGSSRPGPLGRQPSKVCRRGDSPGSLGFNDGSTAVSRAEKFPPEILPFLATTPDRDLLQLCFPEIPHDQRAGFQGFDYLSATTAVQPTNSTAQPDVEVQVIDPDALRKLAKMISEEQKAAGPKQPETAKAINLGDEESQRLHDWVNHIMAAKGIKDMIPVLKKLGITGTFYEKSIKGKRYMILKGYPGLRGGSWWNSLVRGSLRGTKYLEETFKTLRLEVGRADLIKSGVRGSGVTFVFVATIDVAQFFLDDQETLAELGVNIVVDLAKTILAAAGATLLVLLAPVEVPALVAGLAGVAVCWLLSKGLDWLDSYFKVTERLKKWANEFEAQVAKIREEIVQAKEQAKRQIGQAVIDMTRDLIQSMFRSGGEAMKRYLWEQIRRHLTLPTIEISPPSLRSYF